MTAPNDVAAVVASIIPEGATGLSIGLQGASLYVSKDGTAQFVIADEDMAFEEDRTDDAGGLFWVCRLPLGEIEALRDKLNGMEFDGEKEARLAGENARLEYERGRLALDLLAEMDKSRRAASALKAFEAKVATQAATIAALQAEVERAKEENARAIYEGMSWIARHQKTYDFTPPPWAHALGTRARLKAEELAQSSFRKEAASDA